MSEKQKVYACPGCKQVLRFCGQHERPDGRPCPFDPFLLSGHTVEMCLELGSEYDWILRYPHADP